MQNQYQKQVVDDLHEFSVVYTDRSQNMLSVAFQKAYQTISKTFRDLYKAEKIGIVPGSGTFGMEAVARQFARGEKVMVLRNGFFSFRWSEILQLGNIPKEEIVLKARVAENQQDSKTPKFQPLDLQTVIAKIEEVKPAVFFAAHVETSTGIILPDSYITEVAAAVHKVGGIFVLDCIASGNIWVDMNKLGIDVLVTAPQKGWSGPACVGIVLLSANGVKRLEETQSDSFACNLKKWVEVNQTYDNGGFMYYTTLPTDSLMDFANIVKETEEYGFEKSQKEMEELGRRIREALEQRGFQSLAADGYRAPGVVVSYSNVENIVGKLKAAGLRVVGGVPLKIDEPIDSKAVTFRVGLFGLDKLKNLDKTVQTFSEALDKALQN